MTLYYWYSKASHAAAPGWVIVQAETPDDARKAVIHAAENQWLSNGSYDPNRPDDRVNFTNYIKEVESGIIEPPFVHDEPMLFLPAEEIR